VSFSDDLKKNFTLIKEAIEILVNEEECYDDSDMLSSAR
jgi:hypothetical protein